MTTKCSQPFSLLFPLLHYHLYPHPYPSPFPSFASVHHLSPLLFFIHSLITVPPFLHTSFLSFSLSASLPYHFSLHSLTPSFFLLSSSDHPPASQPDNLLHHISFHSPFRSLFFCLCQLPVSCTTQSVSLLYSHTPTQHLLQHHHHRTEIKKKLKRSISNTGHSWSAKVCMSDHHQDQSLQHCARTRFDLSF